MSEPELPLRSGATERTLRELTCTIVLRSLPCVATTLGLARKLVPELACLLLGCPPQMVVIFFWFPFTTAKKGGGGAQNDTSELVVYVGFVWIGVASQLLLEVNEQGVGPCQSCLKGSTRMRAMPACFGRSQEHAMCIVVGCFSTSQVCCFEPSRRAQLCFVQMVSA